MRSWSGPERGKIATWNVRRGMSASKDIVMKTKKICAMLTAALVLLVAASAVAQAKKVRHERRPAATKTATASPQAQPTYEYFSILNGTPQGLWLHHDTEVGTGAPVDVYLFAIELQVLNSDGDLEPEGLIIDNFYTAKPQSPLTTPNPLSARDCKIWNGIVQNEIANQPNPSPTWSYVEFTVAQGARVIQTNEDGAVWWSDDIECWGSRDRFPPF
jgi:streptogramin lyase